MGKLRNFILGRPAEPARGQFAVDRRSIPAQIFGLESYEDPIAPVGRVSRESAIQVPAVKRARDLIAGSIGRIPLRTYDAENVELINALLPQPERNKPRVVTMTATVEDLLFEKIAWWRVVERTWTDYPLYVKRIDPWRVNVNAREEKVYINGEHVPDRDLIRFDSPADALLVAGARAIRIALKLDATAAQYADDPQAREIFVPAEDADELDDTEVRELLADWRRAREESSTAYIPASLKLLEGKLISPKDLQLADARTFAKLEIANAAGIDPEEVGVSTTSRTYANQFDRRKSFTDFTLGLYITAIEERLSMGDVTPRGQYTRFDLDDFMRSANPKERYEGYKAGLEVGAIEDENEVRALEHKPPLTRERVMPRTPAPPAASRFDTGGRLAFAVPAAPATFKVDAAQRTITGLAAPFGPVGHTRGVSWIFSKDSFVIPEDVTRVKLLINHDPDQAIGYAQSLEVKDDGLHGVFKVARGETGDRYLALAEDKVYDGISVGLDHGGELELVDDDTYTYKGAPLLEASLTPIPAFADARVSAVAASAAQKGNPAMDCLKCGQHAHDGKPCDPAAVAAFTAKNAPPAPPAPPPANVDLGGMFAKLDPAKQAEVFAMLAAGGKPVGPEVIKAGETPTVQVKEEAPYRFVRTKNRTFITLPSKHDFSRDLFAAYRGDGAARKRAEMFIHEAFEPGGVASKFDVDTADVTALNPTRQRPDMYVDQKAFVTPFYDALFKGTLEDQTPFTFPKFSSATGLVAAHVQGIEPTPGTFVATSQTVTPSAMSGKVEMTREVVDAGGNPQVSTLIWNKMVRAWYEAMEAAAVAVLDAASPTAIALAAGAQDVALVEALKGAIVDLQFIRGGNTFNFAGTHIDLYKALSLASDTSGRPLLPQLGPTNADGTAASRMASLDVAGVEFAPAWSLGATGSVVESSYLVDTNDVHVWNTAPRRLDFEYRVAYVDLAIWGYTAAAISDLTGVREITYDPVA